MAILQELPHISVTVEVDGVPLAEHPAPNDDIEHNDPQVIAHQSDCTTTNYIESTVGKHFAVKLDVGAEYKWDSPRLRFSPCIDGEKLRGHAPSHTSHKNGCTKLVAGVKSGRPGERGTLRRFKFVEIQTSEDIALDRGSKFR